MMTGLTSGASIRKEYGRSSVAISAGERYILASGNERDVCNETIVAVFALRCSDAVKGAAGPENGAGVSISSSLSLRYLAIGPIPQDFRAEMGDAKR
jgi:hypothetical protein